MTTATSTAQTPQLEGEHTFRDTYIGYGLLLLSFAIGVVGQNSLAALLIALIPCQYGYWKLALALRRITKDAQFVGVLLVTVAAAVLFERALHLSGVKQHWMSWSLALSAVIYLARLYFFRFFTHTRFIFFELGLSFFMFACWVMAIVAAPGWGLKAVALLLPLVNFFFAGIMTFQYVDEGLQLLRFTRRGYQVNPGDIAPDFELPDENGIPTRLSSFRGQRNILLLFVRGDWCPHCHMMLRTYEKFNQRFQEKDILLIAVGPDPVGVNKTMVLKLGLDYRLLSDDKLRMAATYGVEIDDYRNFFSSRYKPAKRPGVAPMPLPASFLVDKTGTVRYTSRPDRVGEFLNPAGIFEYLNDLR